MKILGQLFANIVARLYQVIGAIAFVVLDAVLFISYFTALVWMAIIGFVMSLVSSNPRAPSNRSQNK